MADRITATDEALDAIERLSAKHGALMLFQSGGCCDGSSPLCLQEGELLTGPNDVLLGRVGGMPVYIDGEQDERWNRPRFVLDVAPRPRLRVLTRGSRRHPLHHALLSGHVRRAWKA